MIRFGSCCSGIEAASVAWHPLGWKAAWLSEIEPFPCAVLAHHYPDVPNLGDMTTLTGRIASGEVEAPDVFTGGTPCQAFSVAGKRGSLADARGNLSLTFCEIADAIDDVRAAAGREPSVIVWENVPGVLSTADNAFGCFLGALAGAGCELQPAGGRWTNAGVVLGPRRAVAWRVLDAQYFGLAQRRRRVFVVASAREGFDPAAVLFEFDGVRRDSAPSREAGKIAPTIPARSLGGGGLGTDFDCDGGLVSAPELAACLTRGTGLRYDTDTDTILPVHVPEVAGTMKACKDSGGWSNSADHAAAGYMVPVAFDTTQITSKANYSNPQPGDACHPLAAGAHAPASAQPIAFQSVDHAADATVNLSPTMRAHDPMAVAFQSTARPEASFELAYALRADSPSGGGQPQAVQTAMQVRRLTPTECERLQGFPDGYTAIPWRTYQEAKRKGVSYEGLLNERGMTLSGPSIEECPDGPRYKALGNSWAVPVVRWIGRRIQEAIA